MAPGKLSRKYTCCRKNILSCCTPFFTGRNTDTKMFKRTFVASNTYYIFYPIGENSVIKHGPRYGRPLKAGTVHGWRLRDVAGTVIIGLTKNGGVNFTPAIQ